MRLLQLVLLALLSISWLFTSTPALASSFLVTAAFDAVDSNPGDGQCRILQTQRCTLRAAIQEANALPGPDTITLPANTYVLTIGGNGENAAATGDLDITGDLQINGAGAATTIVDGGALDTVFDIRPGPRVLITGVTVRNGQGVGYPGGIANSGNLTLTNCVIANNTATAGNAGGALNNGTMLLHNCRVTSNTARSNGGGLYNRYGTLTLLKTTVESNVAIIYDGGGIANNLGRLILDQSTVASNMTLAISRDGGGIWNDSSLTITNSTINFNQTYGDGGGIWNAGSLAITNSTISRNTSSDETGGGIFNRGAAATLNNVTITDNWADDDGGGVNNAAGMFNFQNTIIATNYVRNSVNDCAGVLNSQGYNLIREPCVIVGDTIGNILHIDPLLAPLAGSPATHALLAFSPAINAANPDLAAATACAATDERGMPRPQGPRCDMGAYELQVQ